MTTPARALFVAIFATALVASLAGCSTSWACPAIGYINTATFDVRGSDPADIRMCVEDSCAASNDQAPSAEPLRLATPDDISTTAVPSPDPSHRVPFTVRKMDVASFAYNSYSTTARVLEATALDSSGSALGTTTVRLDWKRVGGSAQCGGPMAAHATLTFD